MFKLAEHRGDGEGLYCGREGLFLGPAALIAKFGDVYRSRREDEPIGLLAAAYGADHEAAALLRRLPLIREALQKDDLFRAMILAVHARIGPLSAAGLEKLARAGALGKYNFNPDEPRDAYGRWTDGGEAAPATDGGGHPALLPVEELLPFALRPPFFFEEPPETLRPFKEAIPRLSGKEGTKDIPSWARGKYPYVGETGRQFARRLMDQQYGRGNWESNRKDQFNQLKKCGDRSFHDPRSILPPDDKI